MSVISDVYSYSPSMGLSDDFGNSAWLGGGIPSMHDNNSGTYFGIEVTPIFVLNYVSSILVGHCKYIFIYLRWPRDSFILVYLKKLNGNGNWKDWIPGQIDKLISGSVQFFQYLLLNEPKILIYNNLESNPGAPKSIID